MWCVSACLGWCEVLVEGALCMLPCSVQGRSCRRGPLFSRFPVWDGCGVAGTKPNRALKHGSAGLVPPLSQAAADKPDKASPSVPIPSFQRRCREEKKNMVSLGTLPVCRPDYARAHNRRHCQPASDLVLFRVLRRTLPSVMLWFPASIICISASSASFSPCPVIVCIPTDVEEPTGIQNRTRTSLEV